MGKTEYTHRERDLLNLLCYLNEHCATVQLILKKYFNMKNTGDITLYFKNLEKITPTQLT